MIRLDHGQILITTDELIAILKKEYDRGARDAKKNRAIPQNHFSLGSHLFRMGVMRDADREKYSVS